MEGYCLPFPSPLNHLGSKEFVQRESADTELLMLLHLAETLGHGYHLLGLSKVVPEHAEWLVEEVDPVVLQALVENIRHLHALLHLLRDILVPESRLIGP